MNSPHRSRPLLVLGVDGGAFQLIDPWLERGLLPNLARARGGGVWANTDTGIPPTTSPNWKRYATGQDADRIGVFWWENISFREKRVWYPRARQRAARELWDHLSDAGLRVGVINMPTTWPPKTVNGFMVAGAADARAKDYTYPRPLQARIESEFHYRVHPTLWSAFRDTPEDRCAIATAGAELVSIMESQLRLASAMLERERPDFLHVTVFYVNTLQHYLWDDELTLDAWKLIDHWAGRFLEQDADLLVVSDHGSNPIEAVFNVNTWLQEAGYLKLRRRQGEGLRHLGIDREHVSRAVGRLGLRGAVGRLPERMRRRMASALPSADGSVGGVGFSAGGRKTELIDWDQSLAVASGQGPVYVNERLSGYGEDRRRIIERLKRELAEVIHPLTGEPALVGVHQKGELCSGSGPYFAEMPELYLDQAPGIHIPDDVGKADAFEGPRHWKAENKRTGMMILCSPESRVSGQVDGVRITDIAPSILAGFGLSLPSSLDGKPVAEVLEILSPNRPAPRRSQRDAERMRVKRAAARIAARV